MANVLIINEKPSVSMEFAKALGVKQTEKHDGYIEGYSEFFGCTIWITWAIGHLVTLSYPETYDEKYKNWNIDDLPLLPEKYLYEVIPSVKKQFQVVKKLLNSVGTSETDKKEKSTLSRDKKFLVPVTSLIEATDAGREGELIFRLVYHQAKCKKPFERLWISSMEDKAIREGFKTLRPSSEYDALYEAALCRERADWLVGINATRLFSTLYGQSLNVGRVMTPTLGMIVNREAEINKFRPEPFYTVEIDVLGIPLSSERIRDKAEAEKILSEVSADGNAVITNMKETIKTEKPPLLYDLTSLQRDANKYYGFTAQETLDYTQSLYEKKLVTYPRTDSRYLTDDMGESTRELAISMEEKYGFTKKQTTHEERLLNSKKVSDHHAIIPTVNVSDLDLSSLNDGEQKILNIIAARLLSALGDPAEIKEYDLSVTSGGHTFTAKSKVITNPGWKEIENRILGRHSESDDYDDTNAGNSETGNTESCKNSLKNLIRDTPDLLSEGSRISISDSKIKEGMTTPKKRFTESSLLSSMERAGAEETPDEAERKGLGTPATRAGIIEKLVRIGFVERKGDRKTKYLVPTHKGIALITVMPEMIQSPIMTAEWEQKLLGIEKKIFEASEFMKEIQDMITGLIDTYKIVEDTATLMDPDYKPLGKCPCCGSDVIEKPKGFFCSNKSCRFALWKDNRFLDSLSKKMTKEIAVSLLKDGRCRLKKCRSIRTGKTYDTTLVLTTKDDGQAGFILDFDKKKK